MKKSDHKHAAKKACQHTVYKSLDGEKVPGVTSILADTIPKPALIPWANNLGLQGIKVKEYVDELALIGSLAHYLITCNLSKIEPNLDDYSANQIGLAGMLLRNICLGK